MTAVALYGRALGLVPVLPAEVEDWWPDREPVCTVPAIRRADVTRLVPSPRNEVHAYYPFVAATLGVRVVRTVTWAASVEVPS